MTDALIDNDVLFKTTMYGLAKRLFNAKPFNTDTFHVLSAAKFIIIKKLQKTPPTRGVKQATEEFQDILKQVSQLEPTEEELALAAELEYSVVKAGGGLDPGESQLCAILLNRKWGYVFTGDKRAIIAISQLLKSTDWKALSGKIVCLEQLIKYLLNVVEIADVRPVICKEPDVDKALTAVFSCKSASTNIESCREGLDSYIRDLNSRAPDVLSA